MPCSARRRSLSLTTASPKSQRRAVQASSFERGQPRPRGLARAENADGSLKSCFLKRDFKLPAARPLRAHEHQGSPMPWAHAAVQDPDQGPLFWRGGHPIAPGAQKVDLQPTMPTR